MQEEQENSDSEEEQEYSLSEEESRRGSIVEGFSIEDSD